MKHIIIRNGLKTERGNPYLLGANLDHTGCNFAVFSHHATEVNLLLFHHSYDAKPSHIISFDKTINKTGDVWHIYIYGIKHGQYYGYTVNGPYSPEVEGHRFNVNKLLIDPYSKAISGSGSWNQKSYGYQLDSKLKDLSFSVEKNYNTPVKSIVIDCDEFNWENDNHLNIPLQESIVYEMHVRGFTIDKSSKVKYPGTYLGIIEKIPYLKDLGITTIELLPVHEFNEFENFRLNPQTNERLTNFWGYSTLGFFAPETWYSSSQNGIDAVNEFKTMVKACHQAGIEVIIDVVYNHTAEGNELGPTLHFRGLDNTIYYMLDNGRHYKNYSGCGNTLNCNHPVVKHLILDSLRYWVIDMHIDGFRFDLAAILGRDINGLWFPDYSVLSEISYDPILSNTKIIAEGWDAAGLYKVGGFPSGWAEWNGKFRDDVRSFIRGDNAKIVDLSKRITGSADLFYFKGKHPYHSINFITAHDGFTLNDLVSYNEKNNLNNGENNQDGENHNLSFNYGVEGPSDDVNIIELRHRQMKNLLVLLFISQGTPMMLSGDEIKFTKAGNNNTYCQDNILNWFNWDLVHQNKDFFDFCKFILNFRKTHPVLRQDRFFVPNDSQDISDPDISWHGIELNKPDWSFNSHSIAFLLNGTKVSNKDNQSDNTIYVAINSYWEDLIFNLPEPRQNKAWYLVINTEENPGFYPEEKQIKLNDMIITVKARSIIILMDY